MNKGLLGGIGYSLASLLGLHKKDAAEDVYDVPEAVTSAAHKSDQSGEKAFENDDTAEGAGIDTTSLTKTALEDTPNSNEQGDIPRENEASNESPIEKEMERDNQDEDQGNGITLTTNQAVSGQNSSHETADAPFRDDVSADIDLETISLPATAHSTLEYFGLYTIADLEAYYREELVELQGVTYDLLNFIERNVSAKRQRPFILPGTRKNPEFYSHRLGADGAILLERDISALDTSLLIKRQLRKSAFLSCRQIAFASRDELLDCPGIDLETTFELESLLGNMLGSRIILGCYKGEPPLVVKGQSPYQWRLSSNQGDKPDAGIEIERPEDAVDEDVPPVGIIEAPDITPTTSTPSVTTDLLPATTADIQEKTLPESQWEPSLDDDEYGDWDEGYYDSDVSPSETSDDSNTKDAISIIEWASESKDVYGKVILCLLNGQTKKQAGLTCKLPASTVESLLAYGLNRRPVVAENVYAPLFQDYDISQEQFVAVFEAPVQTYRYLALTYEAGRRSVREMLNDRRLSERQRSNLKLLFKESTSSVAESSAGHSHTYLKLGTADSDSSLPSHTMRAGNCPSGKTNGLGATGNSLYYADESSCEDYCEDNQPESRDEYLKRLASEVLNIATMGIEYSTEYFRNALPSFSQSRYCKNNPRTFNDLLQEAFRGRPDITFPGGYFICFGDCSRTEQIYNLMVEMAPVTIINLRIEYERRYGVSKGTINSWLFCIKKYLHGYTYMLDATEEKSKSTTLRSDQEEVSAQAARKNISAKTPKRQEQEPRSSSQVALIDWILTLNEPQRHIVQQAVFGYRISVIARKSSMTINDTLNVLTEAMSSCPDVREDSFFDQYKLCANKREFCFKTGEPEATYHFLHWRWDSLRSQSSVSQTIATSHDKARDADAPRDTVRAEVAIKTNRPQNAASSFEVRKRIAAEVDRLATLNREYSPNFFYRALPGLMKECGIASADQLYDVLKAAYKRDPDVGFDTSGAIQFGRCDRESQLRRLLSLKQSANPSLSHEKFVADYRRSFGFTKQQIEGWLREYKIVLPHDNTYRAPIEELPNPEPTPSIIERSPVPSSTSPAVRVQVQANPDQAISRAAQYEDFLRGELCSDCCDRQLIVERFRAQFPHGPKNPFTASMLMRLGYQAKGKKLLLRNGIDYKDYFASLIRSKTMFARGDRGFEDVVFNDPQFRQELRRSMRSFEIVEFEIDSYINTAYLCEQMNVSVDDVRSYSSSVASQLREVVGVPIPFTIWSLRNRYHIHHPLDALASEGGIGDYLFETLFDIDPQIQCCTLAGKRGFLETEGEFSTSNFIECVIEMNGPMELDDLIDLLRDAYGISYQALPLRHIISASSLYYDDITDSVFNNHREWEEMVERELA